MNDLLAALRLLTAVPMPAGRSETGGSPAKAMAWFPVVGLGLGLVVSLASLVLRSVFNPLVSAAMVVGLWVGLTGALHLDGFADACDSLFAAASRERRLEILRDVHLGTFGAAGLILLLIAKVAAASTASFQAFLIAPVMGRWAMTYASAFPLARNDGMAAMFRQGVNRRIILAATVVAALLAGLTGVLGLASFVASALVATLIAWFARNRLGGLTGDIYGMICESVELVALLVGSLQIR